MSWMLAWRIFRSRNRHAFIGFSSKISIIGIAIGIASLIVVLAVMSGFEEDLIERVVGTHAHLQIEAESPFVYSDQIQARLMALDASIRYAGPIVLSQGLIETDNDARGVLIRGSSHQNESQLSDVDSYLQAGKYPHEGSDGVLIGDALAKSLRLMIGDKIKLRVLSQRKVFERTVVGVFHSGMYEYDSNLVYLPLSDAQDLLKLEEAVHAIAIKYNDPMTAILNQQILQAGLGFPFYVRSWRDQNKALFGALKLEKLVMFLILTLIVVVACFNVVGTLTLLVMERAKDIGVMRAIGMSRFRVYGIFTRVGLLIGIIGTGLGLAIGLGVTELLDRYPIISIPREIYYFDKLPISLKIADALFVSVCAFFLSLASTIYPALIASKIKVVEALRYE